MTLLDESQALHAMRRPNVRGELPGPGSAALLARQDSRESNARVYGRHFPIAVEEASGSFVRDVDGNVFIDFLTGAGVLSLGHGHPELVEVAAAQLGRFSHGLDLPSPAKDAFTTAQLSMLPDAMRDRMRVHFCGPTGANAVDAALKLCKTATGRGDVVAFSGGFHGTTHTAMAVTGTVATKAPVANLVPGVHFFPYSHCADCPLDLRRDTCSTNCIAVLERALRDPNGGITRPAAVLVELVQGEGGVVPADLDFVRRLRALTRELDVPLVVDEVQTGCGRTGTWFAFEQYGIEPDVIVASKALSGIGQPVSIIVYDERLDVWAPGAHTGTFRGNQVAFAAGARAVEIVRRDGVLDNVRARAAQIGRRLDAPAYPPVGARRAGPRADVGDRAGRPGDGGVGGGAGRAGAGPRAAGRADRRAGRPRRLRGAAAPAAQRHRRGRRHRLRHPHRGSEHCERGRRSRSASPGVPRPASTTASQRRAL